MTAHPFRAAVESGRFDTIGTIFAENGVLHSPIARRPYQGRDVIALIVATVARVLQDFRFEKELTCGELVSGTTDHALMFTATVAGLPLQGCDFVHTGDDGLIDEITVMMRPLTAVSEFAARMRAELSAGGTSAAP